MRNVLFFTFFICAQLSAADDLFHSLGPVPPQPPTAPVRIRSAEQIHKDMCATPADAETCRDDQEAKSLLKGESTIKSVSSFQAGQFFLLDMGGEYSGHWVRPINSVAPYNSCLASGGTYEAMGFSIDHTKVLLKRMLLNEQYQGTCCSVGTLFFLPLSLLSEKYPHLHK